MCAMRGAPRERRVISATALLADDVCKLCPDWPQPPVQSAQDPLAEGFITFITKEKAEIVFQRKTASNDQAGLKRSSTRFLRDWRRNERPTKIDPRLFDLVWEVLPEDRCEGLQSMSSQPIRSPPPTTCCAGPRGGQAKKSQHMMGTAMDFFIPGVKLATLRANGHEDTGWWRGLLSEIGLAFIHARCGKPCAPGRA